jgi:hypothetical protein
MMPLRRRQPWQAKQAQPGRQAAGSRRRQARGSSSSAGAMQLMLQEE